VFRRLTTVGGRLDAERQREGANQRTLASAATKLINDLAPQPNREKIRIERPIGTFDGGNVTFSLSCPVTGQNIIVIWGDTVNNITVPLTRGNTNPPAAGGFFFDPSFPTGIVVGNPPNAADALFAIFDIE
jgi:hypothetical protein